MSLFDYHYRHLEWISNSGTSEWHDTMQQLTELGYIIGEWAGSIEYAPYQRWKISIAGEKALKAWKQEKLIASTDKCKQCQPGYACEVYKITPCIKCGRDIINP